MSETNSGTLNLHREEVSVAAYAERVGDFVQHLRPEHPEDLCFLILCEKDADIGEHDKAPYFVFPAAHPQIYLEKIIQTAERFQSVGHFLSKPNMVFAWMFVSESRLTQLMQRPKDFGPDGELVSGKIAYWRAQPHID